MLKNTLLSKNEDMALKKYIKPVFTGVCFGLAISFVLLFLFSVIVSSANLPQSAIGIFSFVALVLGSFVAGFVSSRIVKKNGLIIGLITGAILFLILIVSSLFVVSESFSVTFLVKALAALLASGIGGILGVNYNRKR